MKAIRCFSTAVLVFVACWSCGPIPDIRALGLGDLSPPVITGVTSNSETTVELQFLEPAYPAGPSFQFAPTIQLKGIECTDNTIVISTAGPLDPGREYLLDATVADAAGNTLTFVAHFFGYNPEVPVMVVNELTVRGSGSHPDLVEIAVLSAGNLAGVALLEGVPGKWSERIILPAHNVAPGDFLLIHFKPQGIASEVDELLSREQSGGFDASPDAWDYWVPDGDGLPGNNGVVSLCRSASGPIIDAVVYSNRTSESDSTYSGFGSATMLAQVEVLAKAHAWKFTAEPAPEDAVNPEDSTATRSIARASDYRDEDSSSDWHIVPTRGSTFGAKNSDEVYQ